MKAKRALKNPRSAWMHPIPVCTQNYCDPAGRRTNVGTDLLLVDSEERFRSAPHGHPSLEFLCISADPGFRASRYRGQGVALLEQICTQRADWATPRANHWRTVSAAASDALQMLSRHPEELHAAPASCGSVIQSVHKDPAVRFLFSSGWNLKELGGCSSLSGFMLFL